MNGFTLPKGKGLNNEVLYFHFIPDYFFTSESWELVESILSRFSDEARVRMAALAKMIFNSKYVGSSTEMGINVDVYNSWIKDLAVKEEDEGSKGMACLSIWRKDTDN